MINISEGDCTKLMNDAISEQILMYYNRYLYENGWLSENEYHKMSALIISDAKNRAPK